MIYPLIQSAPHPSERLELAMERPTSLACYFCHREQAFDTVNGDVPIGPVCKALGKVKR